MASKVCWVLCLGGVFEAMWTELGEHLAVGMGGGRGVKDGVFFVLPIFIGWDKDGEALGVCVGGHYDPL